ncbi:MAG: hypothetical protein ACOYZ8_10545 [Chloroflexota bacterium]
MGALRRRPTGMLREDGGESHKTRKCPSYYLKFAQGLARTGIFLYACFVGFYAVSRFGKETNHERRRKKGQRQQREKEEAETQPEGETQTETGKEEKQIHAHRRLTPKQEVSIRVKNTPHSGVFLYLDELCAAILAG